MFILAGTLFHLPWAILASVAGMYVAASLNYLVASRLARSRIQRMIATRPQLNTIQRAVTRDAFRMQLLLRLTPLNQAILNYMFGAIGVRFRGFLVACLVKVPGSLVDVFCGHAGKHFAWLAGGSDETSSIHVFVIAVSLVSGLAVVFCVSKYARKSVVQAVAQAR